MPSLEGLGWDPFFEQQMTAEHYPDASPARVVWEGREQYLLSTGDAEWRAHLAGRVRHTAASSADLPVVGDWVVATFRPAEGTGRIERRLARRSQFARAAAGRKTAQQVIAANIDTVLLVTSFNRDFNLRRLERYLALAWESGARPLIVLNKADLCGDPQRWLAEVTPVSQGVPLLVTSALRGQGIAEVHETVRTGGTTAVLGSSGVGKSTIINALLGEQAQAVLPIRTADDRGRHSTTARQLICLPRGGILIDTPGMRELQLWDADAGLEHAFADIEGLSHRCRFRDCSHGGEPGCAVADAVSRGHLAAERLDSYRRLQREDEFVRSRDDQRARSERARKTKQLTKAARLLYKLRRR
jgi:ribosome biogenesis GTPase